MLKTFFVIFNKFDYLSYNYLPIAAPPFNSVGNYYTVLIIETTIQINQKSL